MDTIEVRYALGENKAIAVIRDGELLYKYDVWNCTFRMLGSKGNDIARFKRKEINKI